MLALIVPADNVAGSETSASGSLNPSGCLGRGEESDVTFGAGQWQVDRLLQQAGELIAELGEPGNLCGGLAGKWALNVGQDGR